VRCLLWLLRWSARQNDSGQTGQLRQVIFYGYEATQTLSLHNDSTNIILCDFWRIFKLFFAF